MCFGAGGFLNIFLRSAMLCVCLFVPFPSEQLIQLKRAFLFTPFHVGPRLMVLKGNAAHHHRPYSLHRGIFSFLLIPGWPWRGVFCTLPSSVPSTLHSLNPTTCSFFPPSCYCSGRECWQQNKQPWQSVSRQPRCCQASVAAFVFERSELHCCVGCSLVHPKSDVRYGCPWRFIIKALIRPRLKHRIWNGWSKSFDVGETATQSQKYLSFSSRRRGMFYYFLSTFFSSWSCPFLFHVSVHAGFGCLASLFM